MNQNELRIGNFVSAKTTSETFNIVCEIGDGGSGRGWYVRLENVNHGVWLQHNDSFLIEGIEITEEWLLKFGFEKSAENFNYFERVTYHNYTLKASKWMISFQIDKYNILSCGHNYVKYVHQLQNLYFALVGSELQLLEADA